MRFEMSVKDRAPGGFELTGPFSLRSDGHLPVAELDHTRFDGDEDAVEATFVSTGDAVYVVRDGKSTRVPDDQLAATGLTELVRPVERSDDATATGAATDATGLGRLDINDWIDGEPKIAGGGLVGGVDTDKVTANLDAGELMQGLVELGRTLGGGVAGQLEPLSDDDRARVRRAAKIARLETWSGKDDGMLRKLVVSVTFGLRNEEMAEKMPLLSEASIRLEAAVTDVNGSVEVEPPDDAR